MLKKWTFLFLFASLWFCTGLFLRVQYEKNTFIVAEWEKDPIVIVCPDSHVTAFRLYGAIEWWAIRGYYVKEVHWDDDNKICSKGRFVPGVVFIRAEGKLLPDTYAITSRLTILNEMISAVITLPNEQNNRPRLLEHELGHAFGMTHVEEISHIMHPIHESGGEKFWIPD